MCEKLCCRDFFDDDGDENIPIDEWEYENLHSRYGIKDITDEVRERLVKECEVKKQQGEEKIKKQQEEERIKKQQEEERIKKRQEEMEEIERQLEIAIKNGDARKQFELWSKKFGF